MIFLTKIHRTFELSDVEVPRKSDVYIQVLNESKTESTWY